NGDLGAEAIPNRPELETDDAAANDDEVLRYLGDLERADVRQDALLVEFQKGELDWYGAGGDDDVPRLIRRDFFSGGAPRAACRGHVHHVAGAEGSKSLRPRDLVLSKQEFDSLCVLPNDVVFPLEHRRQVERELTDTNPVRRRRVSGERVMLGRREE